MGHGCWCVVAGAALFEEGTDRWTLREVLESLVFRLGAFEQLLAFLQFLTAYVCEGTVVGSNARTIIMKRNSRPAFATNCISSGTGSLS